eukprot:scaffold127438_cov36-Attheya_sp.AAC.1
MREQTMATILTADGKYPAAIRMHHLQNTAHNNKLKLIGTHHWKVWRREIVERAATEETSNSFNKDNEEELNDEDGIITSPLGVTKEWDSVSNA